MSEGDAMREREDTGPYVVRQQPRETHDREGAWGVVYAPTGEVAATLIGLTESGAQILASGLNRAYRLGLEAGREEAQS